MDKAAYPRNEMAFALSPLSLDRFPFKINPVVENRPMHLTATDEAFLVSTVFAKSFEFKLHMGLPEQKRTFVRLVMCLTLQMTLTVHSISRRRRHMKYD